MLRSAIFDWIEGWYNTRWLHSSLGYVNPAAYEATIHDRRNQRGMITLRSCPSKRAKPTCLLIVPAAIAVMTLGDVGVSFVVPL